MESWLGPAGQQAEWAVKAARLIDGTGVSPIRKGVVAVRGDRIAAVGLESAVEIPPRVPVLDLGDETLLPGFIDTHNHPTLKPIGTDLSYFNQFYDPQARQTARAVRNLRIDLLSGVTTVRVVSELNFIDVTLAKDIEDGIIPGPWVLPSGPRLAPTGGHLWIPEWAVEGPENIRRTIRNYVSHGSRLIKLGLLDESPDKTSYSEAELSAVVSEAHGLGVPVTAHCTGLWGSSIRLALKAGVDVIEHVVPLNDQVIEQFLKAGAAMSLTPFVYRMAWPQPAEYWHFEDFEARSAKEWIDYNAQLGQVYFKTHPEVITKNQFYGREVFPALEPWMEGVRKAWKAGVPVAVGSDAPHGAFPLNVEFLVDCGIPPLNAIAAATGVAARVRRVDKVTGVLAAGKSADLISVRGNPLDDIKTLRNVHLIARGGQRFDGLSFT